MNIDDSTTTEEFIGWTIERFRNRRVVLTTSFGMEGCALIDMYAQQGGAPTVVYLDTGFFYPETYALRDRMVQRYPLVTFVNRGTSLTPDAQADFSKKLVALVEKEGAGYDFAHYRDAPAGLRIWCGATVEANDVALLTQWIDWAFAEMKSSLAKAA